MIRAFLALSFVAVGCLQAEPGLAQRPDTVPVRDTSVFRVEGIRIQAARPVTTVGGASALEARLDSLGLSPAPSVEEVLRALPLVHVRTNSRGEAEVSIRGSESRQVALLLDGVPLSLGWDARTDMSLLPAGAATEVSVVRGLSSILHGPNVLGGVVELNVGRAEGALEPSLDLTAGADHLGGYGSTAVAARPISTNRGRAVVRAGVGFRDSPGFALPKGVAEPVETDDDLRLNTDLRSTNGFVSGRYRWDGGAWASLSAAGYRAERGIAAELEAAEPRLWRYPRASRTVVAASAGTGFRNTPWGRGDLEVSLGIDDVTTRIEQFASRAYGEVVGGEAGDGLTRTLRLLGDHSLGRRGELRASFTHADIRHDALANGDEQSFQQHLSSVAGETVWRLVETGTGVFRSLRLSFGGAWDRGSTPRTGGLPSLGTIDDWGGRLGLSGLVGDGGTLAHVSVSRRGRFPSLRETYSEALDRFVPNPALRPERLIAVEAGVTTRLWRGEVQLVGFQHGLDGAIRRITLEDGRRQRVNADELRSRGVEFLVSQSWSDLSLSADLMLQDVDLIPGSDGESNPSTQPENVPEVAATLRADLVLSGGWSARAALDYTGSQFCQDPDSAMDVELAGAAILNGALAWASDRVEGRLSVSNASDTLLYDQCGLPRPGRVLQLQFRMF